MRRSRACLAEPPAESPSTMNSSVPSVAWPEQSASLPGRRSLRVAEARATSLSLRFFIRSSARSTTNSSSWLADLGWPESQWSMGSRRAVSTRRWASEDDSRSLVWPWNSGLRTNTEIRAPAPPTTSSAVITPPRLSPVSSA